MTVRIRYGSLWTTNVFSTANTTLAKGRPMLLMRAEFEATKSNPHFGTLEFTAQRTLAQQCALILTCQLMKHWTRLTRWCVHSP